MNAPSEQPRGPLLSMVVVLHDMEREAPRTMESLSARYQQAVAADEYEVVVVDNGSSRPAFTAETIRKFGANFRYEYIPDASPSPAPAVARGVELARGAYVGIMIDGARVLTPGVLHQALAAFRAWPNPVVVVYGFHLGPEVQSRSVLNGYGREEEDRLLQGIGWPGDGYRLFEISCFAGSCEKGWFVLPCESNCLFLAKSLYERIGGVDQAFDEPGGGFVNLDLFMRAVGSEDADVVALLGEGCFHQVHGGAATGSTPLQLQEKLERWHQHYIQIRGRTFAPPVRIGRHGRMMYSGLIPPQAYPSLRTSIRQLELIGQLAPPPPPPPPAPTRGFLRRILARFS